jgi:sporulation protein YlmC with PRC-barrel domain
MALAQSEEPAAGEDPAVQTEQPAAQEAPAEVLEEEADGAGEAAEAPEAEEPAETEMETADSEVGAGGFLTTQDEKEYRAANLIGVSVMNSADEEIGEVTDIVLNEEDQVVGVVLSVGGFLGIGDKWVGIPIEQVEFNEDEETARAEYASEQLENAPPFTTIEEQEAEEQAEAARAQMNQQTGDQPAGTATAPVPPAE